MEIITCDPSLYTMDHSDFFVSSFMENSIGPKRVNWALSHKTTVFGVMLRLAYTQLQGLARLE